MGSKVGLRPTGCAIDRNAKEYPRIALLEREVRADVEGDEVNRGCERSRHPKPHSYHTEGAVLAHDGAVVLFILAVVQRFQVSAQ